MYVSPPRVALIGRPNVGKSTMFNRLIGKKSAIVEDMPGVTRDRKYGESDWNGLTFTVIDTGGLEPKTDDEVLQAMKQQTELAIEEAHLVIFVVDGREGMLPQDMEIVQRLRREELPFLVAVNKIDNQRQETMLADFYALGVEHMYPVSSVHGHGLGDMLDVVVERIKEIVPPLPEEELALLKAQEDWGEELPPEEEDGEEGKGLPYRPPRIAVLGKPNAGKSTLINQILGEERLLTMPIPGTTRDAIDVEVTRNENTYTFIDTAGLRRKKNIKEHLEQVMVGRSLDALGRCDIMLHMIDATEGVTEQDTKIAGLAHNRGRGVIIIVNKWDLMNRSHQAIKEYEEELRHKLRFLSYAPVLFCSAKTGLRIDKVFQTIDKVYNSYCSRVKTGELNRFFSEMIQYHPPPVHRGRSIKFYYITQVRTKPPSFMISANQPNAAHVTYKRFIINSLREEFGFMGVPIKLHFRSHH